MLQSVHKTHQLIEYPIDYIRLRNEYGGYGPPVLFQNHQIRSMLRLANANERDVFYDLGCGFGQNLIVAVTEFDVKKAIGVEYDKRRHSKAQTYKGMWPRPRRIEVIKADFQTLLEDDNNFLRDATIIFYGLDTDAKILRLISDRLSPRRNWKLVYYFNCLFPELKPDKISFPFYLSIPPFEDKEPHSGLDWLRSVIQKDTPYDNKELTEDELWAEMAHDYRIAGFSKSRVRQMLKEYQERLR